MQYFTLAQYLDKYSFDFVPIWNALDTNGQFKFFIQTTLVMHYINETIIYPLLDDETKEEYEQKIEMKFSSTYNECIDLLMPYIKYNEYFESKKLIEDSETHTYSGNETTSNQRFKKYAQTPTSIQPTEQFVDNYTDAQEKNDDSGTRANTSTRNIERDGGDEKQLEYSRKVKMIQDEILRRFAKHFILIYD